MQLFNVFGKLSLDAKDFNKGMSDANSSGESFASHMEGVFGKIETAAKLFISGAAIKKVFDFVTDLANATSEAGDRIDKQSQILGMSRRAYQEWDYILGQNGVSIDSMTTAMKTLNGTILSGIDGSEDAKDAFAQLGVGIHELEGLSQEAQFEAVVRAFQRMPAGADKAALATKLFGRAGMQLLPLLNSESTSIDELRAKAEQLGLIMSDDAVDASVEYNDAMDTMKRTFDAMKYSIGSKVLPFMTQAMDKVSAYTGKLIKAFDENGLQGVWDTVRADITSMKSSDSPFLSGLANVLDGIADGLEWVAKLFTDFEGTVNGMKESDNAFIRFLGGLLEGLASTVQWVIGLFTDFEGTINNMRESDNILIRVLADIIDGLRVGIEWLIGLFDDFPNAVKQLKESDFFVFQILGEVISTVHDGIQSVVQAINGDYEGAVHTLNNSESELLRFAGATVDAFADAKKGVDEFIDSTKEAMGMSGSGGRIYESWAGSMKQKFGEATTESEYIAWQNEFLQGLRDAEVQESTISKMLAFMDKNAEKNGYGTWGAQYNISSMLDALMHPNGTNVDDALDLMLAGLMDDHVVAPEVDKEKIADDVDAALHDGVVQAGDLSVPVDLWVKMHPTDSSLPADAGFWSLDTTPHHAKGEWDVPYDDYLARLHRGETVLTASQARDYKSGNGGFDVAAIAASVASAVKGAIESATIRSYINGRDITQEVNRNTVKQIKARRFAT